MGNLINALLGLVGFRPPNQTCKTSANPSSSALSHGIKVCKECKWYKHFHLDSELSTCVHPKVITLNPVTGKIKGSFCSNQRLDWEHEETCGKKGQWYENLS